MKLQKINSNQQPCEIMCGVFRCKYHKPLNKCEHKSPSIALGVNGKFSCWSEVARDYKATTLDEWISFRLNVASAKTMWAVVSGTITAKNIGYFKAEIPYDKDDFGRCYNLWKDCQLTDNDLQKIKETFPIWEPFIDNWQLLVRMYENNENINEFIKNLK